MREPTRRRAAASLGGAVLLAVAMAAPAVLAQDNAGVSNPADWEGSTFTSPSGPVSEESFAITGVFTKVRQTAERITQIDVSFQGDGPTGSAPSPDDPTGVESTDCVPDDPPPFLRSPNDGSPDDTVDRFEFRVDPADSVWPCNGRYTILAAGQSNQEVAAYEITTVITVAAPPAPVTVVNARWDGDVEAVEVVFEPLGEDELAVDAIGYRVERAGPDGDAFAPVGDDLGVDDEPVVLDEPTAGGDYRYRVRAIRAGPDGPVLSVAAASAVAEVTVPGAAVETTTTTTTAARSGTVRSGGRRSGASVTRGGASRPSGPPTTADTGFDETIDYGDRRPQNELAGQEEGQSIIRTEGEGAGLVAPVAGALVLLGWAGHIAYLNRLAKQF
jgi:hypothetical protein